MKADIDRYAVFPLRSGVEVKRELRDLVNHLFQVRVGIEEIGFLVRLADRIVFPPVSEARGLAQEIATRDLTGWLRRLTGALRAVDRDILEGGDVLRHRLVEHELPFLEEDHDGRRRNRLGHGVDPKNGIGLDRFSGLDVGEAERLEINQLAVPSDGHGHTRENTPLDIGLHDRDVVHCRRF
ncbi:MAG: hypothetical protein P8Y94_07815 [Acidobacteriota bacterium]